MTSGEITKPGPSASPPLTPESSHTKAGHSSHRGRGRSPAKGSQKGVTVQYSESISTTEEVKSEFPSIMSEIFKEDITYRALARKFLWEFFD